jgi:SOS-response transcriptional repressor LexA
MSLLTKRQRQVLELIVEHLREFQRPPTLRWLRKKLGVSATNTPNDLLNALERKRYIDRFEMKSAGIRVTRAGFAEVGGCCPFCGGEMPVGEFTSNEAPPPSLGDIYQFGKVVP